MSKGTRTRYRTTNRTRYHTSYRPRYRTRYRRYRTRVLYVTVLGTVLDPVEGDPTRYRTRYRTNPVLGRAVSVIRKELRSIPSPFQQGVVVSVPEQTFFESPSCHRNTSFSLTLHLVLPVFSSS